MRMRFSRGFGSEWPNRFKRERMRTVSKERGEYLTCLHGLGTVLPSELEIWHRVPGEKMILIRLLWQWTTKIRGTVSSPSFESPLKWTRVRRSIIHYPIIPLNFCWSVAEIFHLRAKYGGNIVPLETKMMAKMIVMEWFDSYHYI